MRVLLLSFALISTAFAATPPVAPTAAPVSMPSPGPSAPPAVVETPALDPGEVAIRVRDPFKRMLKITAMKPKSELEQYAVDAFKMTGVMNGTKGIIAMVQAPNGRTFYIKEKMKLGNRNGVVSRITSESIKVREKGVNILGQEETVVSEIKMPSSDQGGDSGLDRPSINNW